MYSGRDGISYDLHYSDDPYEELLIQIVMRAVIDWWKASRRLQRDPHDWEAKDTVTECEFFLFDIKGGYILRKLKEKLNKEADNEQIWQLADDL